MTRAIVALSILSVVALCICGGWGPEKVTQYSGYITVNGTKTDSGSHLFYWMFEARNNPKTAPFIIWLTGGPGCSSQLALFVENGPYTMDTNGTIKSNPYSWNTYANILYIDQPVGTGFSYGDHYSDYVKDEAGVAEDMYQFLIKFFAQYPQYSKLDLYLIGESYAGHYIPAIGARVVDGNKAGGNMQINMKGIGIGNGWVNPAIQYSSDADLLYENFLIPEVERIAYNDVAYPTCELLIDTGLWPLAVEECNLSFEALLLGAEAYSLRSINIYDVRERCEYPPLCYDFSALDKFLSQTAVRKSLGVSPKADWTSCSRLVGVFMLDDLESNFAEDIPKIIDAGVRVLIYNGVKDLICNFIGTERWLTAMEWSGQSAFNNAPENPWYIKQQQTGTIRSANGLTFIKVFGAGHMVPMNQPAVSLAMIQSFINNKPF
jgi:serine carboxypeptidase-like clade 4